MTCKISFIKSVRETLKHHVASIFATCLVFFTQFVIYFLCLQNFVEDLKNPLSNKMTEKEINEWFQSLTQPNFVYAIPVILVAILLAYDFFRYLHSKKQIDFYESLPINRKQWFFMRTVSSFLVFFIPFIMCICLEMLLLVIYGYATSAFISYLLWNALCMIMIFAFTWLAAVLAMVMTGNSVIALFAFGVFNIYFPVILQYLISTHASTYFDTYNATSYELSNYLNYLSPIGAAIKLLSNGFDMWNPASHTIDFSIVGILILVFGVLLYWLFVKRPSESAGRAMTFTKVNPAIRIMLVIPLSLYLGLCLNLVTVTGSMLWAIFGYLVGCILLNGIIESIFEFDIRKMLSHKIQMGICFVICLGFACVFWFDLVKFDSYLPKYSDIQSINFETNRSYGFIEDVERDGITGDGLKNVYKLAEQIIEQDVDESDSDVRYVNFEYKLKSGRSVHRRYVMDLEANRELLDSIYATEDYKDDYCPLYTADWDNAMYIMWSDHVDEIRLDFDENGLSTLFETYLSEYTELTYTEEQTQSAVGYFNVVWKKDDSSQNLNVNGYKEVAIDVAADRYYVYPKFTQTIQLLNRYITAKDSFTGYGLITDSVLERYEVDYIEVYTPDEPTIINDETTIDAMKSDIIIGNSGSKEIPDDDYDKYYELQINFKTDKVTSVLYGFIPKEVFDKLPK